MNVEPTDAIRVPHEALESFVSMAAQAVGLPADKAELLARLLTETDLRGVFSHGTQQIARYAECMRDGTLNNNPQVKVVRETPVSVLIDGDGGLGYFPAHEGTRLAIEKAKAAGMATLVSRNHGHFGAAGIYARMPLAHDMITFVTSGAQRALLPGGPLRHATAGSPMAFATPSGRQAPLVVDFGAGTELYESHRGDTEFVRLASGTVFRTLGLGAICQAWGGLLAGLAIEPERSPWDYAGANQGALVMTARIDLFIDPDRFKREMDSFVEKVRALRPLPGFSQAMLAGGPEAYREALYRKEGVPVGREHRDRLEGIAAELGLDVPWSD